MIEGVILLLLISVIVRVIPSLIGHHIRIPQRVIELISMAVFVNILIYCFFSEVSKAAIPTIVAFAIILLLVRKNLLLNILLSSAAFIFVANFMR